VRLKKNKFNAVTSEWNQSVGIEKLINMKIYSKTLKENAF